MEIIGWTKIFLLFKIEYKGDFSPPIHFIPLASKHVPIDRN